MSIHDDMNLGIFIAIEICIIVWLIILGLIK